MIRIKVQYDESTRSFKLVDQEFRTLLEGDALYDLLLPFTDEFPDADVTLSSHVQIGRA